MFDSTQAPAARPTGAPSVPSAPSAETGRARVRPAIAGAVAGEHAARAAAIVERFGDEFDAHAELIAGPDDHIAGFLTRGECAGFTERTQIALAELGLDAAARDRHAALAAWFEHRRGFVKDIPRPAP